MEQHFPPENSAPCVLKLQKFDIFLKGGFCDSVNSEFYPKELLKLLKFPWHNLFLNWIY